VRITINMICRLLRIRARHLGRPPTEGLRAKTSSSRVHVAVLIFAAAALSYPFFAQTAAAMGGLFDTAVNGMQCSAFGGTDSNGKPCPGTTTMVGSMLGMLMNTVKALGVIELCWAATIWAFEKDNLNSLAIEMVKKVSMMGLLLWLMQTATTWVPTIMQSFIVIGVKAAGRGVAEISTDSILEQGLGAAAGIWATALAVSTAMEIAPEIIADFSDPAAQIALETAMQMMVLLSFFAAIIAIGTVIAAAQFFMLKVESTLLLAAGVVLLALGSTSWTKDYLMKYVNYALTAGMRMLVLLVILGVTTNAIGNLGSPNIFADLMGVLNLVAVVVLQAFLSMRAPELASALMSGGAGLTAGSITQAAQSVQTLQGRAMGAAMGGGGGGQGRGGAHGGLGNGVSQLRDALRQGLGGGHDGGGALGQNDRSSSVGGLGGGMASFPNPGSSPVGSSGAGSVAPISGLDRLGNAASGSNTTTQTLSAATGAASGTTNAGSIASGARTSTGAAGGTTSAGGLFSGARGTGPTGATGSTGGAGPQSAEANRVVNPLANTPQPAGPPAETASAGGAPPAAANPAGASSGNPAQVSGPATSPSSAPTNTTSE
jgi:type IV secretion system protein TrbL